MKTDTCDTVKNLERELAAPLWRITVEQAYKNADNQRAKDAWATVMDWAGPKARINRGIYQSFQRLMVS